MVGCLVIIILIILFVLIADYYDLPSKIGLHMGELNYDVQAIAIEAMVTILLFIIAYYLIDQRSITKQKNQEEIAKMMIATSYKLCRDYIAELDKQHTLDFLLRSKIKSEDPDKLVSSFYDKYEEVPFDNHERIMQFCADGILSKSQMVDYLQVKHLFSAYVSACVCFQKTKKERELVDRVKQELLSKIEDSLSNL